MRIELHPDVLKQLQRLQHEVAVTALVVIDGLAENPRPRGAKKLAGRNNDWRLRSGQYRIVYEIDAAADILLVFVVSKLGDAYRDSGSSHAAGPRLPGPGRHAELVIGRYSGRLLPPSGSRGPAVPPR